MFIKTLKWPHAVKFHIEVKVQPFRPIPLSMNSSALIWLPSFFVFYSLHVLNKNLFPVKRVCIYRCVCLLFPLKYSLIHFGRSSNHTSAITICLNTEMVCWFKVAYATSVWLALSHDHCLISLLLPDVLVALPSLLL